MNRNWGIALAVTLMLTIASMGAMAQDEWAPDEMTGIEVGEKAPDFTLEGHDGKEYALADLLKEGTVVLMFYRSANW